MYDLVSIIVPVYNVEKFLKDCIQSILNQTYQNIEIVLIDDGSTDSSRNICENFQKVDNRINLYCIENSGVSYARNVGIKKSSGKYIMFCDSDDIYHPDCVKNMVYGIKKYKGELTICSYERFTNSPSMERLETIPVIKQTTKVDEYYNLIILNTSYSGYLWNKIFLKEIILKNDLFFDCKISELEDLYFVIQYLNYVHLVTIIDKPLYYYRYNSESIMNQSFNIKKYSAIHGLNNIYLEIKQKPLNTEIKKRIWTSLIIKCFLLSKKIILNSEIKNKKCYLKEISSIYLLSRNDFKISIFKEVSLKIKKIFLNMLIFLEKFF